MAKTQSLVLPKEPRRCKLANNNKMFEQVLEFNNLPTTLNQAVEISKKYRRSRLRKLYYRDVYEIVYGETNT